MRFQTIALLAAAFLAAPAAGASAFDGGLFHENGVGPDPDGDTNPATRTWAMARIGADDARLDPRFSVVTFEPPPGKHGDRIVNQYSDKFGVSFSKGVKRQICDDQRYFQYDTMCTYLAPPSGAFAAHYRDDLKRPLAVAYSKPVCAAALSVFPIGGRENEKFEVTLQPFDATGEKLEAAKVQFSWTQNTFRWRVMVGGFFLKAPASRLEISMKSLDPDYKSDVIQFLMDDLGSIEKNCEAVLADIREAAGIETAAGNLVTRSAQDGD